MKFVLGGWHWKMPFPFLNHLLSKDVFHRNHLKFDDSLCVYFVDQERLALEGEILQSLNDGSF